MPYPNHHACRIRNPEEFQDDSFRTIEREHEGKTYNVILGKPKGDDSMVEQSYRYPKDVWDESEARSHCESHEGTFEPAADTENKIVEVMNQLDIEPDTEEEFVWYDDVSEHLLAGIGKSKASIIRLRLHSYGGDLFAGVAVANLLHQKKSVVTVEGMAASAASLIAASGKVTNLYKSSYLVIHNPWTMLLGDYRDCAYMANLLESLANTAAEMYSKFAQERGKNVSKEEFRKLMDEESWLTAEQSVNLGLADVILDEPVAFKLTKEITRFKKVPKNLLDSYYANLRKHLI